MGIVYFGEAMWHGVVKSYPPHGRRGAFAGLSGRVWLLRGGL